MAVIKVFPAHSRLTVQQALGTVADLTLTDVLVIGYNEEGSLIVRSSEMTREAALWLLEKAKLHALGVE